MGKRQLVQISTEQLKKIKEIDSLRPDLAGYPISKKVAFLLHEKLAETYLRKDPIIQKSGEQIKWLEYMREQVPLHVFAQIAVGIVKYSKEMIGEPFTHILIANDSDKSWWFENEKNIDSVGAYLLTNLQNENFAKNYYKKYHNVCRETKEHAEKVRLLDLSKLSNQKILDGYASLLEKTGMFHGLTLDIDAIDVVVEKEIKDEIKKIHPKITERELSSKYNSLVTPVGLSYVTEEQILLYSIAQKVKNFGLVPLFDFETKIVVEKLKKERPELVELIDGIVEKYWWISLGWANVDCLTRESIISDIKNIIREEKDLNQEIERMKCFPKDALAERNRELALTKSKKLVSLIEIFDNYFAFHDLRKEIQMRTNFSLIFFLLEIARRTGQKFSEVSWCWSHEIESLLKTGYFDREKALARKESLFVIVSTEGIEELTGEKAALRRKKETAVSQENIRDFRGVPASMGRITGRAKICFSAADALSKIETGDVLVAPMTLPDFVPAMKKAKAIVTDEGGITAHAAIISRELKIPCLVGTKIATKVLNDGDLIEVNANHAVVTVIKKFSK
jgi:phosphoenolpyruvate synthase/pyruvate phosphate dikinase